MTNPEYWDDRMKRRLVKAEMTGDIAIKRVLDLYEKALIRINQQINEIYLKYSTDTGLDVSELTQVLSGTDRAEVIRDIQGKMKLLGFKVGDVYNSKYLYRLNRLEAIKQQIYWDIQVIGKREISIQTRAYEKIIRDSYKTSMVDLREQKLDIQGYSFAKGTGFGLEAFATLDKNVIGALIRNDWAGRNFKNSATKNREQFTRRVQEVVSTGLVTGSSAYKMRRMIREEFGSAKYDTMRLIRTETSYFQNQSDLESYIEDDIEYYRFTAVMDGITSDICIAHNDKVYRVDEAIVGYNFPPLHPNCRSRTVMAFPEEVAKGVEGVPDDIRERYLENEVEKDDYLRTVKGWGIKYKDSDGEFGVIVDKNSGEILEQASGTEGDINFNLRQWNVSEGNVIVHNHPYNEIGTTFSPSDITIGVNKGAYETIVVGREGLYGMTFGDISQMSKQEKFKITEGIKDSYISYIKEHKEYTTPYLDRKLWEDVAIKYGFSYWFEKFR